MSIATAARPVARAVTTRLYDARHSCSTVMHLNAVPAAVIAAWLGHTDARFTLSVYAHSNDNALAAAAAVLGEEVRPPDSAQSN